MKFTSDPLFLNDVPPSIRPSSVCSQLDLNRCDPCLDLKRPGVSAENVVQHVRVVREFIQPEVRSTGMASQYRDRYD